MKENILNDFLIKAKISGYATGGEGNEIKLPDGGKKFQCQEQGFEYRDVHYGFNPFSGQEVVRKNWESVDHFENVMNSEEFKNLVGSYMKESPHYPGVYEIIRT